jgi:AcrR family transcriptional regulator
MVTQAERRAATSSALRTAARKLFARNGFDAVSVDDIAADAGVTRGAFYHHFDSKEALFEVVLEEVELALVDAIRTAVASHADPLDQLLLGIDAFIEHASDRRHSRIALVDAPAVLGPARYQALEERHFLGPMRSSMRRLRPDIATKANDLTTRALMAAVCSLAAHAAEHRSDLASAKAVARSLIPH